MKTLLVLILLQLGWLKSNDQAAINAKIYLEDAKSHDVVGFVKLGQNGNFQFSNLDPGVYNIIIEIPENSIKEVDRRMRSKYSTDILVAYNSNKKVFGWQRKDGFLHLSLNKTIKLADIYQPLFDLANPEEKSENESIVQKKTSFFERLKMSNPDRDPSGKIAVLQITVAQKYGSVAGSLMSVAQSEFYKLMVGSGKVSLENQGIVNVLLKEN